MRWPDFIGPSYQSQSQWADIERLMNWFVEPMESPGAKNRYALYPTPGQQTFLSVSDVGTRALFSMNGRTHAVVGSTVYELFSNALTASRGTVVQDSNMAQIAYNGRAGNQLLIASGGNGYCLNLTTNVLTPVLAGDCVQVGMIDEYFLAFNGTQYRISNLNDGLTWDPTQFIQRSIAPDPWQAMVVDGQRQIWLIGEQTGEVHYNAGSFPFPFAPIPGAVFKFGTPAPWSVVSAADSVMWLSQTSAGAGMVVQARGYTPSRVSTFAVETAIANYQRNSRITDAEALVYEDQGHVFYVLNFPSANATWVYDLTTQQWHERGTWNSSANQYDRWHPRVHCYAFGKHLVGENGTNVIGSVDTTFGSEVDGRAIRRMRIAPGINNQWEPLYYRSLELYMQTGLGLASGQGSNPMVMLRTSDDAGMTWSSERTCSAGAIGQFGVRVMWLRMGRSYDRTIEVTVSDPTPWRLVDAFIDVDGARQGGVG